VDTDDCVSEPRRRAFEQSIASGFARGCTDSPSRRPPSQCLHSPHIRLHPPNLEKRWVGNVRFLLQPPRMHRFNHCVHPRNARATPCLPGVWSSLADPAHMGELLTPAAGTMNVRRPRQLIVEFTAVMMPASGTRRRGPCEARACPMTLTNASPLTAHGSTSANRPKSCFGWTNLASPPTRSSASSPKSGQRSTTSAARWTSKRAAFHQARGLATS
jgi:hypothetical protein